MRAIFLSPLLPLHRIQFMESEISIFLFAVVLATVVSIFVEYWRYFVSIRSFIIGGASFFSIVLVLYLVFIFMPEKHVGEDNSDNNSVATNISVFEYQDIQPNMPNPKDGAEVDRFQEVRQIDIDTQGISGESLPINVARQQGKKTREQQTVIETPNLEGANIQEEVSAFLQRWQEAWENSAGKQGDMENFNSLYADDFRPHGGHSRSAWLADKAMKNRRKSWIKLKLSDVRISDLKEGNEAQVRFLQAYSSSNFSEKNSKTLILRKEESGWKIVSVKLD